MRTTKVNLGEEEFIIDGQLAIIHEKSKTLIVADFVLDQEASSPQLMPAIESINEAKQRLSKLITKYQPTSLYLIGDPAPAAKTSSMNYLREVSTQTNLHIVTHTTPKHMIAHHNQIMLGEVKLQHNTVANKKEKFVICGSIKPAIELKIPGKGDVGAPCMWVSEYKAVMPSFTKNTGYNAIKPKNQEQIYLFADGFVIKK